MKIPYQTIYEIIEPLLPQSWERIVLYIEYADDCYEMKFYVKKGNKYIDCFKLPDASKKDVMNAFSEIDELLYPIRQKSKKKDAWKMLTITISDNGSFHADYSYDDPSNNRLLYITKWKEKYLV